MMRVLHFINAMSAGGAEIFVSSLAGAMAKSCPVAVATYAGVLDVIGGKLTAEMRDRGVEVFHFNCNSRVAKLSIPARLSRVLNTWRPDVVNVHLDQAELFCAAANALVKGKPRYVRTLHTTRIMRMAAKIAQPYLRKFYHLHVACSGAVFHSKQLHLPRRTSTVIQNGIRLPPFPHDSAHDIAAIRQRLGLPTGKIILLNVGSMSPRGGVLSKGQDLLIDAVAEAADGPEAELILIGDGSHRFEFERMVQRAGLMARTRFTGIVENVSDYIRAADLIVMPSRQEGLPLAAIEVACLGKPLVLSNIQAFGLFAGSAVKFFEMGKPKALAQTLRIALLELSTLTEAAARFADVYRNAFDIELVAKNYLAAYANLLPIARKQQRV